MSWKRSLPVQPFPQDKFNYIMSFLTYLSCLFLMTANEETQQFPKASYSGFHNHYHLKVSPII